MDYKLTDFLPTTKKECELRGWDELDVILFQEMLTLITHPSVLPFSDEYWKPTAIG